MLPSNPSDRVKIASKIDEIVNTLQDIKDRQSFIKDIKADLRKEFDLSADQIKEIINLRKERAPRAKIENDTQELLDDYEMLFNKFENKTLNSVIDVVDD